MPGDTVKTGSAFTVILTESCTKQLLGAVTITLKKVVVAAVTTGFAIAVLLMPAAGDHWYLTPPVATNRTGVFLQTVVSALRVTTGSGLVNTVTESGLLVQPNWSVPISL